MSTTLPPAIPCVFLDLPLGATLSYAEGQYVAATLTATAGDRDRTARLLGCTRRQLYHLIRRHRLVHLSPVRA